MKLSKLLYLLPALWLGQSPMSVSAQTVRAEHQLTVQTAVTDSITYSETDGQYTENLWRNGTIYQHRPVTEGASLLLDWTKPKEPTPGVVFAQGVTRESGWYDVNKKGDGRTGKDGEMCWAAACANMLEWWQDRYKERYGALPATAITGAGKEYELALFEIYQTHWENYYGSEVYYGIPWYLTGEDRSENAMYVAHPIKPGGFFAEQWTEISQQISDPYVYEVNGYATWGDGWEVDTSTPAWDIFSQIVIDAIDHGMASISIRVGYSNMHAITLWGYELNEQGRVNKVYVTDSDDLISKPKEPRVQLMQEYEVVETNGRSIGIKGAYDGINVITQIVPFKANLPH